MTILAQSTIQRPETKQDSNPDTILSTALYIHSLGFNVVPTDDNKRVIGTWKRWQTKRQTENDVKRLFNSRRNISHIGVITGVGGLVCIDFDATVIDGQKIPVPRNVFHQFLHHARLPNANGLERSMSGAGWHLWLRCSDLPTDLTRLTRQALDGSQCDHIELRAYDHQAVIVEPDVLANLNTVRVDQMIAGYDGVTQRPPESARREYIPTDYDGESNPDKWINDAISKFPTTRNDGGFWLACQLRDDDYSRLEADSILLQYQRRVTNGSDPYTEREALASVKSAYSKSSRERATSGAPSQPSRRDNIVSEKKAMVESTKKPPAEKYFFDNGIPAAYLELLLSQEKTITGDIGNGAAIEHVLHLALIGGELETDSFISRRVIENVSKMVGHPLTRRTIDNGLQQLADLGRLRLVQNCTLIKEQYIGCRNVQAIYTIQTLRVAFEHMTAILEYQVPSSFHDWLPSVDPSNDEIGYSVLSEFERLHIADVVNPDDIDQQLKRLENLSVESLEQGRAFVCPDGFTIENSKSLRIAYLRYLYHCEGLKGEWQLATYKLAQRLGVSERTVSAYRREAGLNTRECFTSHNLDKSLPLEPQIKGLTKGRQGGVRLFIGEFEHHYLHGGNRKHILSRAMASNKAISLVIQQPSIMYDATPDEIEQTALERSERLAKALERKQADNQQMELLGIELEHDLNTPPDDTEPDSEPAPLPELKAGYSRAYIYHHLKLLLDQLLAVVDQSPVIENLLIDYGLYKKPTYRLVNLTKDKPMKFRELREHREAMAK
jgi:hypothetical protein